ncbi:MAG: sodium:solute symporter family protein [Synergistaceae bacterium]|jgi:SSS family solute:Na+ symporter|nr:sodium:solute symporter family protein [Synergistaceae bacterium]
MKSDIIFYAGIISFVLLVGFVFLGIWYQRRVTTASGFLMAGRGVPFWLQASAIIGGAVGGASISGWTGLGYTGGMSNAWPIIAPGVFLIIYFLIFARRLNYFGRKHDAITITDFVCARYGEKLRLPIACFAILRPAILTGMQFLAIAAVLQVAFDIPLWIGVLISAVLILLYIITAGQYSAILTQWLQGILQTLGAFLFIYVVFKVVGDPTRSMDLVFKHAPSGYVNMFEANFSMVTVWVLTLGLFYLVDPWVYMYSYMGKTPRVSTNAQMMGQFAGFLFGIIPITAGLILFAAQQEGVLSIPIPQLGRGAGQISADGLYSWFTFTYANVEVGSLIIVGLLMTIISCGSSFAMNGVTIISRDIYQKALKKGNFTDKEGVFASRIACVVVVLIGIAGALWLPILVPLWSLTQALVISALMASVLAAWFWRRSTAAGAIASCIGGGISSFAWAMYAWFTVGSPGGLINGWHAAHVGLAVSIPLMIIVSLATKADDKSVSDVTNYGVISKEMYSQSPDFKNEHGGGIFAYYGAKTPASKFGWGIATLSPILIVLYYLTFQIQAMAVSLFWIILIFGVGMFALFSVIGFFDLKNMIMPAVSATKETKD